MTTLYVALPAWGLCAVLAGVCMSLRRRLRIVARAEHELRGPLTSIGLALAAIGRGRSAAVHADALEVELDRARAALDDLGGARAGHRAPPRLEAVAVEQLVRRAATGWGRRARGPGGRVRLDWRAGAATVHADRRRVSQAIGNLLANAVEHGGERIDGRGSRTQEGVRLEISDSGRPAGPTGVVSADRRTGRGHGLAIAAEAVREANGTMTLGLRDRAVTGSADRSAMGTRVGNEDVTNPGDTSVVIELPTSRP